MFVVFVCIIGWTCSLGSSSINWTFRLVCWLVCISGTEITFPFVFWPPSFLVFDSFWILIWFSFLGSSSNNNASWFFISIKSDSLTVGWLIIFWLISVGLFCWTGWTGFCSTGFWTGFCSTGFWTGFCSTGFWTGFCSTGFWTVCCTGCWTGCWIGCWIGW